MKKYHLLFYLILLNLTVTANNRTEALLSILKSNKPDYIFVVAHRGDWRHAPENSIAAIKSAISIGADMVEIDIQKTKDGDFVLMHDNSIDRTTNGKGYINNYTVKELKNFKLRYNSGELSKETIPTLKEALSACKGKILVNIDKGENYLSDIEPIIKEAGMENYIILKGRGSVNDVKKKLSLYKNIIYMPIVDLDTSGAIPYIDSFLKDFQPIAMEIGFKTDDFEQLSYIDKIAESNCRIWINTLWESLCGGHDDEKAVNDPDNSWGWILKNKATIIQTDRPQELITYLKQKGLRKIDW